MIMLVLFTNVSLLYLKISFLGVPCLPWSSQTKITDLIKEVAAVSRPLYTYTVGTYSNLIMASLVTYLFGHLYSRTSIIRTIVCQFNCKSAQKVQSFDVLLCILIEQTLL